jgi:nitroimidazol reductase NimA-like FMN-containing flavoprotein (pyridoxamine 5'-phosphate oxidase superfamily)
MPSRREQIAMSDAEVRAYLETQRRIILVTNGPGGMPHPVPMNYGLDPEGRIVLTAFRKSQKVKNLERDPRATLLVESGADYGELRGVIVWCDAEILSDPEEVARNMALVRADAATAQSVSGARSEQVRASMSKRVILRFTPFRAASWNHERLGNLY